MIMQWAAVAILATVTIVRIVVNFHNIPGRDTEVNADHRT